MRLLRFFGVLKAPTIALGKRCSDQIEQDECCIGNNCKPPVKPRANGRNIVGCYMLRPFSHSVGCEQGRTLCLFLVPHFIFLRDSRASETRARVKITPRAACRLFSCGVIFTRARVSLALLSLRKNGGLIVV